MAAIFSSRLIVKSNDTGRNGIGAVHNMQLHSRGPKNFGLNSIPNFRRIRAMASPTVSAPKREKDPKKRIVITGMGVVSVFGNDVDIFYDKLLEGESGISLIDRFDVSNWAVKIAGQIRGFSSEGYIDTKVDRRLDDCWRYCLVAGKKALEDANLTQQVLETKTLRLQISMAALLPFSGQRPPDPPDSPRARKKSFADVVSGSTMATRSSITLKTPQTYRGRPAIGIPKSEISLLAEDFKYALVGKFSHGRPKMDVVRQKIASLGLKGTYTVGSIDSKHLVINLRLEEDYIRLWLKPTWYFDSYPMRIFKWSTKFHPNRESPVTPPLKVDEPTANLSRPSLARVCVELDLSRPLIESVWISETLDESPDAIRSEGFWQVVEYDSLPAYCSFCYHVGHNGEHCLHKIQTEQVVAEDSSKLKQTEICSARPKGQQYRAKNHTVSVVDKGKSIAQEGTDVATEEQLNQAKDSNFMQDARKTSNAVGKEDLRIVLDEKRKDKPEASVAKETVIQKDGPELNTIDLMEEPTVRVGEIGVIHEEEVRVPLEVTENAIVLYENPETQTQLDENIGCDENQEFQQIANIDVHGTFAPAIDEDALVDVDVFVDGQVTELQEFSKDDLILLAKETSGTSVEDFAGPTTHPHIHSRRRSDGDQIPLQELQDTCIRDEPQQLENLRRSTWTKKLTFKVRKSPPRY